MFLKYNLFTIIWIFFILSLTMMPGRDMPDTDVWNLFRFDKAAHAFVFAVLVLLSIVGFTKQYSFKKLRYNAIRNAMILSVALGILIEVAQSFVPGRSIELYDIISDVVGCFIGWGTFLLIYKT